MRYQSNHAEVVAEGFQETAAFSIAASGKAFKSLMDGAYSRKIEAAIRELSTNAFDSHKASGSIAPFEAHLPTVTQPTFYIRDFGTGMSHDFMMNRFTVMFDSTKDGMRSEDADITPDSQVGMLGIGRMSFFTVTDSCAISSWQDGTVNHYTVYMGPDEVPRVAHAGSAPSDEPNGVKVEFAVRTKDFDEFERSAIRVFKGFPVMPTGLKTKVQKELRVEPSEVGSFWRTYPKNYLEGSVFWARQGCVLYPVDLLEIDTRAVDVEEMVYSDKKKRWISKPVRTLSSRYQDFAQTDATFVIDFPIGTLDFDLGRERLAYNDRTIMSLRKRWEDMLADVGQKLEGIFEGAEGDWDYMCRGSSATLNEMGLLYHRTPQYEKALSTLETLCSLIAKTRSDRGPAYPIFAIYNLGAPDDEKNGYQSFSTYYARDAKGMFEKDMIAADLSKSLFVIRDGKPTHFRARVEAYMREHDLRWVFVIEKADMKKALYEKLGKPPRMESDDLPPLSREKAEREYGYYGGGGSFDRVKVIHHKTEDYRPISDEDKIKDPVFAFLNRGEIFTPAGQTPVSLKTVMREHRKRQFFTGKPILLMNIRSNEFDKIDEKWGDLPLFYGCNDKIIDVIGKRDLRDMAAIINQKRFAHTRYQSAHETWIDFFPKEKTEINLLKRFYQRAESMDPIRKAILTDFLYSGWNFHNETPFLLEVVEKCLANGIEVLPLMRNSTGQNTCFDLLPEKWEFMIETLNATRFQYVTKKVAGDREITQREIQKFIYTSIRKELQC